MRKTSKKSIIAGSLAFIMILSGTGYAVWTENLVIQSRAMTGEFEVKFVDLGVYAQYGDKREKDAAWSIVDGIGETGYIKDDFFVKENHSQSDKEESIVEYTNRAKIYNNISFDAQMEDSKEIEKTVGRYAKARTLGSDSIRLEINKMYPGYAQTFRTNIVNLGTLAARLGKIDFNVQTENEDKIIEDVLGIALYIQSKQVGDDGDIQIKPVFRLSEKVMGENHTFKVGGVDFVRFSALKELDEKVIQEALLDVEVLSEKLGETELNLYIGIAMDLDAKGVYTSSNKSEIDDSKTQEKITKLDIQFIWDQFNIAKISAEEIEKNDLKYQNEND